MKKVITLLLCAVMALSALMFTACGIFGGNYQETTPEALADIARQAASSENGGQIDPASGVQMILKLEESSKDEDGKTSSSKIDLSFKAIATDGKLQMEGSGNISQTAEGKTERQNLKAYYGEGYMYSSVKTNGETTKTKERVAASELMDSLLGVVSMYLPSTDLSGLISGFSGAKGVKFYVDKGGEETKIKIVLEKNKETFLAVMEMEYNGEIYLVFDSNMRMIASKYDLSISVKSLDMSVVIGGKEAASKSEASATIKISMSIEPWEGKINAPSDLKEYK